MAQKEVIKIGGKKKSKFLDKVREILPEEGHLNMCLTCGLCSSGCPATGLEGLDPRKVLRMAALGMDEELLSTTMGMDVQYVLAMYGRMPYENRYPTIGL